MIQMIRHLLWNQRKQNLWIFLELLIGGFFLWMVIDPTFYMSSNLAIPNGYEPKGLYALELEQYDKGYASYDSTQATSERQKEHYQRIMRTIRDCPEVESVTVAYSGSYPNSGTMNGGGLMNIDPDTTYCKVLQYSFMQQEGSDMPRTFRLRDARTGEIISLPPDFAQRKMYCISARVAQTLYGTVDVVGKKIWDAREEGNGHEIAAVFQDFKHLSADQPFPMLITANSDLYTGSNMAWRNQIIFRIKDGVDAEAFEQRFKQEIVPTLNQGNFFFSELISLQDRMDDMLVQNGVANKLRLQYILTGFALLCIFLGMVGTFWIRSNARREEIGVMRAMGASRRRIVMQFLVEAGLLVTVAFVLILPIVGVYVHIEGFTDGTVSGYDFFYQLDDEGWIPTANTTYPQNNPWFRFGIISLITYLLLMITAIIGTYIPVTKASDVSPIDALHEE